VLNEILGLHNETKAAVHSVHKLTGPKKKKKKVKKKPDDGQARPKHVADVTSCRIQLSIVLCKDGLIQ